MTPASKPLVVLGHRSYRSEQSTRQCAPVPVSRVQTLRWATARESGFARRWTCRRSMHSAWHGPFRGLAGTPRRRLLRRMAPPDIRKPRSAVSRQQTLSSGSLRLRQALRWMKAATAHENSGDDILAFVCGPVCGDSRGSGRKDAPMESDVCGTCGGTGHRLALVLNCHVAAVTVRG